jgi:copper chaperone CopZ
MRHLVAFAAVFGLCSAALAGEENTPVQVTIKGMTCPDGCGASLTKALQTLDGVQSVKLADFDKGLFSVTLAPNQAVKPSAIKAKIGKFELVKVEATLAGTVAVGEKEALTLVTASGAKYSLSSCGDCPAAAGGEKADDPVAKLRAWAKDGKTAVKVSGAVGECCEGALSLVVVKAEPAAPKN